MRGNPTKTVAAIHRLEDEIDALNEKQVEALRTATFVGMTSDEASDYDARRDKITELARQLVRLKKCA